MSINPKELVSGITVYGGDDDILKKQQLLDQDRYRQQQLALEQEKMFQMQRELRRRALAEASNKAAEALKVNYDMVHGEADRAEIANTYEQAMNKMNGVYANDPGWRSSGVMSINGQVALQKEEQAVKHKIALATENQNLMASIFNEITTNPKVDKVKALQEFQQLEKNLVGKDIQTKYLMEQEFKKSIPMSQAVWSPDKVVGYGEGKPVAIAAIGKDASGRVVFNEKEQEENINNWLNSKEGQDNYELFAHTVAPPNDNSVTSFKRTIIDYARSRAKENLAGRQNNTTNLYLPGYNTTSDTSAPKVVNLEVKNNGVKETVVGTQIALPEVMTVGLSRTGQELDLSNGRKLEGTKPSRINSQNITIMSTLTVPVTDPASQRVLPPGTLITQDQKSALNITPDKYEDKPYIVGSEPEDKSSKVIQTAYPFNEANKNKLLTELRSKDPKKYANYIQRISELPTWDNNAGVIEKEAGKAMGKKPTGATVQPKYPLPKGKPITVKQGDYTYTWNESTGKYE